MQGKIKILESDNLDVLKEKKVFENANIHFCGLNTHRITTEGTKYEKDYIFHIEYTTVEAESLAFEGELHEAGQTATSYVTLRFTPFLLKH
tara:strand:- start:355 stop:627 length:273 start_codon:yes stop_codon:yes gene_type:complete